MKVYNIYGIVLLLSFRLVLCKTAKDCEDKVSLSYSWRQNPDHLTLELRCKVVDFSLPIYISFPNETDVGGCHPRHQNITCSHIISNNVAMSVNDCSPKDKEIIVEVTAKLGDNWEGNWTCRWGSKRPSNSCHSSTTEVKFSKLERGALTEKTESGTSTWVIHLVAAIAIAVIAVIIIVVVCIRNWKLNLEANIGRQKQLFLLGINRKKKGDVHNENLDEQLALHRRARADVARGADN